MRLEYVQLVKGIQPNICALTTLKEILTFKCTQARACTQNRQWYGARTIDLNKYERTNVPGSSESTWSPSFPPPPLKVMLLNSLHSFWD